MLGNSKYFFPYYVNGTWHCLEINYLDNINPKDYQGYIAGCQRYLDSNERIRGVGCKEVRRSMDALQQRQSAVA